MHTAVGQKADSSIQFLLVVYGINPETIEVRTSKAGNLQSHEGNMVNKREISREKLSELRQASIGLLMNHNTNLNLLPITFQIQNTSDRLIKSTIRLDNIVVN